MNVRRSALRTSRAAQVGLVLACLLVVPLAAGPASSATTTAGSLTVSRSSGMPGEALKVTVSNLPGSATRPISLQRCVGYTDGTWSTCSRWVPVMSANAVNHGYTFSTRVHAMQRNRYQVVAPASGTNGAVTTPNRPVDGTQQDATIAMSTPTAAGEQITVTLTLFPVRSTRTVALQKRNADGTWTTKTGALAVDAYGTARTTLIAESGTSIWRAVARTWAPTTEDTRVGWFPSFPITVLVP